MLRIFLVVLIGFVIAKENNASLKFSKDKKKNLPTNCVEAVKYYNHFGKLSIKVNYTLLPDPFIVDCVEHPYWIPGQVHDPWNIVLRREWGFLSFNRSWDNYKRGFGSRYEDFFIGLEKLHALTNATDNKLWVQLEDWKGNRRWAMYNSFSIGNEDQGYAITSLGKYSGTAGDSLRYHVGSKFSTFDKDNDNSALENCAILYSSGWWFNKCITSNLNGLWLEGKYNASFAHGIVWEDFLGYRNSLKYATIAIRPKRKKKTKGSTEILD